MSTASLNHVAIRTAKLEQTRQFFEEVVGLTTGPRPPFPFPGYWLYAERTPVVHLIGSHDPHWLEQNLDSSSQRLSGGVDHIAFACTGHDEVEQRLDVLALAFERRVVPATGLRQLFVTDPNGVTIEMNFAASEVAPEPLEATIGAKSGSR